MSFPHLTNAMISRIPSALVQLGAGVGNVVLATPLLMALRELGFAVDLLLAADYAQTTDLLRPWSVVRQIFTRPTAPPLTSYDRIAPALPPFYQARFGRAITYRPNAIKRP